MEEEMNVNVKIEDKERTRKYKNESIKVRKI